MKPYPFQLEISGPTALWTRPDTGSSPVSYVAPTLQHPLRLGRGEGRVRCRIQTNSAVPDYIGPFRPETRFCEIENHELPTMLKMVFDQMQSGMKWN